MTATFVETPVTGKNNEHTKENNYLYFIKTMFKLVLLFFVLTLVNIGAVRSPHFVEYFSTLSTSEIDKIPESIREDSLLDTPKLIEKYGYPAETHEVETEDGYLLDVHRIPKGKINDEAEKRIPVLFLHGILCTSAVWLVNGPEKSLGYLLADNGFDVWLANARGNAYARKHKTLDPNDSKFWKFSWDEIGFYDVPATIDYILNITGHSKLHVIGHSQGSTVFFAMASDRPEYNEKVISMQALGPGAYMSNAKSVLVKYLSPFVFTLNAITSLIGVNEFFPSSELTSAIAHMLCNENSMYLPVCTNFLFLMCGYSPKQLNLTMLPVYLSHSPGGASSKQLIQYAQLYNSGMFRKYDYTSRLMNLYTYGSSNPPDYDLSLVTAPVVVYFGENDWIADVKDVDRLYSELGNPAGKYLVPVPDFNHLDFIWGIDAPSVLYEPLIKRLKENDY